MLATIVVGTVFAFGCGVLAAVALLALLNVAERLSSRRPAVANPEAPKVAARQQHPPRSLGYLHEPLHN